MGRGVAQGQMRENIQVVAKDDPDYAGAVLGAAAKVHDKNEKSKIISGVSQANLEINDLTNRYRIENEGNPMKNIDEYQTEMDGIFDRYGEDIGTLYQGEWYNKKQNLSSQNMQSMQNWSFKQNAVNSQNRINGGIQDSIALANLDGKKFGAGEVDGNALMRFLDSEGEIASLGPDLGEESTKTLMQNYERDYISSFITGTAESNPEKAQEILDSDQVKDYLDPEDFANIQKTINTKNTAFQQAKVDGYKNQIDEVFYANPFKAMKMMDEIKTKGETFREENGFNRGNYDKILTYNKQLTSTYKTKDGKTNPKTGKLYTPQDMALIAEHAADVTTTYDSMDIKNVGKDKKKTELKILNKEYDNVASLMSFRDGLEKSVSEDGPLTDAKVRDYNSKTDRLLLDKLRDNDVDNKTMWGSTTEEFLARSVMDQEGFSDREKVLLFERTYKLSQSPDDKVPLDSSRSNDVKLMGTLLRQERASLMLEKNPNLLNYNSAAIVTDDGIVDYANDPSVSSGIPIDGDNGGEILTEGGVRYRVYRNENGKVINKSEVR